MNLYKSVLLYLKKAKGQVFGLFLAPLIFSLVGLLLAHPQLMWVLMQLINAISFATYLAASTAFRLNSTSFFKKILIHTGAKKYHIYLIGVVVFFIIFLNQLVQMAYQNLLALMYFGKPIQLDYLGLFYAIVTSIIMASLIGLLIAQLSLNETLMYIVAIFIPVFILVFGNIFLYIVSPLYAAISFVNPFKYILYMVTEAWQADTTHTTSLNLLHSRVFSFHTPWMVVNPKTRAQAHHGSEANLGYSWIFNYFSFFQIYDALDLATKKDLYRVIAQNYQQNPKILDTFHLEILASLPIKILNVSIPWLFIIGFAILNYLLDPLKRRKYG